MKTKKNVKRVKAWAVLESNGKLFSIYKTYADAAYDLHCPLGSLPLALAGFAR